MSLFRNVIFGAILLFGAVTAQKCPDGSDPTDILGAVICCPGDVQWNNPSDIKCCVHPSGGSCQTLIPISAPGYTSIVYGATPAAANKIAAATTLATTTSAGMSSSSTSTSTTPLSSGSVSGTSSPAVAANRAVSSSSIGGAVAAAARITAAPVLMGAAAVVLGAI